MGLNFDIMRAVFILAAALLASGSALAERFMGIQPGDRLANIQALFPRAELEELKPAWLQPYQRLVQISGTTSNGVSGIVAFKLEHEVDSMAALLRGIAGKQANRTDLSEAEAYILTYWPKRLEQLRSAPPADPWEVDDIRWVPPEPLLIKTAIAKYGPPNKDELDEQFRRVVKWETRGITAFVNKDDTISVIVFRFTLGDRLCATKWRASKECDPLKPFASDPPSPRPQ
jgi:hypothetical protein